MITAEIRRIEEVECLEAELNAQLLSDAPILIDGEVCVHVLRAMAEPTRSITHRSDLKSTQGECCAIKDLIIMTAGCAVCTCDNIGTIVVI